jgi:threonine/homoserine/homoserine lactone efflux protein
VDPLFFVEFTSSELRLAGMDTLLLGLTLGAAAGVSPGPLLVLVVSSALRSGWRAGVLVACVPVISDGIVVAGVLFVLDRLPEHALTVLALTGTAFIAWTGVLTIRDSRHATLRLDAQEARAVSRQALRQAVLVNLLNPHPWLFWATVLGPLVLSSWRREPVSAMTLIVGFYLTIVGSKAIIAVLVATGRHRLTDAAYRRTLLVAGLLLLAAAAALGVEFGMRALGK